MIALATTFQTEVIESGGFIYKNKCNPHFLDTIEHFLLLAKIFITQLPTPVVIYQWL